MVDDSHILLGRKSDLWEMLSKNKEISDDFLDPRKGTTWGFGGKPPSSEEEYAQRFRDWVERYKGRVSPEDLCNYPEPNVGSPCILEYEKYRASVLYIKNFALAKFITSLIPIRNPKILEIGAGYGGMAEVLMRLRPIASYSVVDLPEVLPLSKYYLTQTHPDQKLHFFEPDSLQDEQYDIVINTLSFGEMPEETAKAYIDWTMRHSKYLISINSVKRTPQGVKKYSDYGFHKYTIEKILPQPDISGAFNAQHLVLLVKPGPANISAAELNRMQTLMDLGLQEDVSDNNEEAIKAMYLSFTRPFFRKKYLKKYLKVGKSILGRAYATMLLGKPVEAPGYLQRELEAVGKDALLAFLKQRMQ